MRSLGANLPLLLLQRGHHQIEVVRDLDLGEDVGDPALFVDDEGRPDDPHELHAIERFLVPDVVGIDDLLVLVDE